MVQGRRRGTGSEGSGCTEGLPEAFCLEPQIHPDAPNQPDFPSILLPAGGRYQSRIRYQLSW